MDIRTYPAVTMHEALEMVRCDLGPEAAVLHTREVPKGGLFGWLRASANRSYGLGQRQRAQPLAPTAAGGVANAGRHAAGASASMVSNTAFAAPRALSDEMNGRLTDLQAMVQQLCRQSRRGPQFDLPDTLFRLFTDLIEADLGEDLARDLVERVRDEAPDAEMADPILLKARIARMVEAEIATTGPIAVIPGRRRLVALVGPTGVGKTTTIAKLAANYRLKEKRNVGLITVDTYRIAAVEQLRTYAEIIDLPMQVVSTPREMREAVRRMNGLDLILMDTAGRSPRDGIKIQELRAFLTEAAADEVHLVLSSVAAARTLLQTTERFRAAGTTGLILTKLDEATGLGSLLPVLRFSKLPLGYLTNGQNVPDDIEVADPGRVARLVLGIESVSAGL